MLTTEVVVELGWCDSQRNSGWIWYQKSPPHLAVTETNLVSLTLCDMTGATDINENQMFIYYRKHFSVQYHTTTTPKRLPWCTILHATRTSHRWYRVQRCVDW